MLYSGYSNRQKLVVKTFCSARWWGVPSVVTFTTTCTTTGVLHVKCGVSEGTRSGTSAAHDAKPFYSYVTMHQALYSTPNTFSSFKHLINGSGGLIVQKTSYWKQAEGG
jgi:hypothetical protein